MQSQRHKKLWCHNLDCGHRHVFETCFATVIVTHLHEAIVEVKSKKRSCCSDILSNSLLQHWHDNVISLRAWKLIELRRKTKRHSSSCSTMMTTPAKVEACRVSLRDCNWDESCYKKNDFDEMHCDKWQQDYNMLVWWLFLCPKGLDCLIYI